jgi:kelch-like protein 22
MVSSDERMSSLTVTSNYATKLLQTVSSMREKPELCDFRIDINTKHLFCHRFLLIAVSDYFRAMLNGLFLRLFIGRSLVFLGHLSESQSDHVELKGFERSSYGFENIDELLHAATHLQVRDAIDLCSQFLLDSCSIKNCIDIYKIADVYSLEDVLSHVKDFISNNFLLLMFQARDQFEQLTYEQMHQELTRDTFDLCVDRSQSNGKRTVHGRSLSIDSIHAHDTRRTL